MRPSPCWEGRLERGVSAVLKLEVIEGRVAVVLPPETLAELGLEPGDAVVDRASGGDADRAERELQLALARQIMDEREAVLRALAK